MMPLCILAGFLTAERLREVLAYSPKTGLFTWMMPPANRASLVGDVAGRIDKDSGYRRINIDGRRYYEHRLAVLYVTGSWPRGEVDQNLKRWDNRYCNLRCGVHSQNLANRPANTNNRSGFKGVSWHVQRKKWSANIGVRGKNVYIGLFDTPELAHAAYAKLARELHGEFARSE